MHIDFYILETITNKSQAWLFVCQLVEKFYDENKTIYLHLNSREEAEQLDNLLWTFKDNSFIPHNIYESLLVNAAPVQIGFDPKIPNNIADILINLSSNVPHLQKDFIKAVEIVFADTSVQQLARERFKYYRDNGYEITTHKLKTPDLKTIQSIV